MRTYDEGDENTKDRNRREEGGRENEKKERKGEGGGRRGRGKREKEAFWFCLATEEAGGRRDPNGATLGLTGC